MKYRDYSAIDFANDSFFIRWVKNPDEESDWFWSSFIKENPACETEITKAREMILLVDFPPHTLTEKEFQGMRNQLLMALRAEREEVREQRGRWLQLGISERKWMAVAASVVAFLLVGSIIFVRTDRSDAPNVALSDTDTRVEKRVNPSGQKSVLFLPDGSKVWLNAASKIKYAKDFHQQETRDIYLEGEAFFDVAHNAEKPFIVHTSLLKIKVLGTSFNVKSYTGEKTIETTLLEGKVRIEQTDADGSRIGDVELKPNQKAIFDRDSRVINVKEVDAGNSASWKSEKLIFDEEPMDDVIVQLERWYNVTIHVEGKGHLSCQLTASIEGESLRDVLNLIEGSHAIRYRIEGTDVYIEGKLCDPD